MHLARKSDARNLAGIQVCGLERFPYCQPACAPPVARILFRPARPRAGKLLVLGGTGCDNLALPVNNERSCTARAYVDA